MMHTYGARRGDFGRLGHGDCSDVFLPRPVAFFSGMPIAAIACGDTHTLVAAADGALYTFGRNQNGQLGLGHTHDMLAPERVADLTVSGWVKDKEGKRVGQGQGDKETRRQRGCPRMCITALPLYPLPYPPSLPHPAPPPFPLLPVPVHI